MSAAFHDDLLLSAAPHLLQLVQLTDCCGKGDARHTVAVAPLALPVPASLPLLAAATAALAASRRRR